MQSGDSGEEDEVDGLDDVEFRPPLPPADRIWRHPSEVAAASRAAPERPAAAAPSPGGSVLQMRSPQTLAALTAAAVLGAALSLGTVAALGGFDRGTTVVSERVAMPPTVREASAADAVAEIVAATAPSIVAVRAEQGEDSVAGTATVLRSDGYLLTNAALVADATAIETRTHDGASRAATVVGIDRVTDVAVLRVDATDLVPAVFGSTAHVSVGHRAIAIGAPDDGGWSTVVTTGVVSALGQRLQLVDGPVMHGMVLFDAPMSPGLAGGPLLDDRGTVIGVTSAVPAEDAEGRFGVATPIDVARHVAEQLIAHGDVRHVWLGIEGRDLASAEAMELGIAGAAAIGGVAADGPAALAGIRAGDVIVQVGDTTVDSMSDLIWLLRTHEPGDRVALTLLRDGERLEVEVELAERTV